ncbi:unnamed protein product [Lepidochelys olivacea]
MRSWGPWRPCSNSPWTPRRLSTPSRPGCRRPGSRPSSRRRDRARELYGDGATRYVLPTMLHPRYTPHRWDGENITQEVPRVLQGELPYTLSRSAMLQSPHGIDHVLSSCPLTPLSYTAGNLTTAQVSLAQAPPWDRELELLVYYTEPPKPYGRAPEDSPLLRLVSLQNADVLWNLDPWLAAVLRVSETDARGRIPSEDVTPSIWAMVLAMVWLHDWAVG